MKNWTKNNWQITPNIEIFHILHYMEDTNCFTKNYTLDFFRPYQEYLQQELIFLLERYYS